MAQLKRFVAVLVALFVVSAAIADDDDVPLKYDRIDLADGRVLKKVVIKSYDAGSGKLLLLASGKAMMVPVDLVPQPFRDKLKQGAPKAGGSTTSMASTSAPPPPTSETAKAETARSRTSSTVTTQARRRRETNSEATAQQTAEVKVQEHKDAALTKGQHFYRYEFQAGSGAVRVTSTAFEVGDPEPVAGWEGRYRLEGRVLLEYFDSKGYSFNRTADRFEVTTEQKPGKSIQVVDFSRK